MRITLRRQPRWKRLLSDPTELRWYHQLPCPSVPLLVRLAVVLAMLTSMFVMAWLHLADNRQESWPMPLFGGSLLGMLLTLGYTFGYFNSVLSLAVRGNVKRAPDVDPRPSRALLSCLHWMACFLAGPAVLLSGAVGYWVYCGELKALDWLILAELVLAAAVWWPISLVLSNTGRRVRIPSPARVFHTAFSLGPAAIRLTLQTAGVFLAHALVGLFAVAQFHAHPLGAILLLCACWTSGLYLVDVAVRRLGLAYHRLQRQSPAAGTVAALNSPTRLTPVLR